MRVFFVKLRGRAAQAQGSIALVESESDSQAKVNSDLDCLRSCPDILHDGHFT